MEHVELGADTLNCLPSSMAQPSKLKPTMQQQQPRIATKTPPHTNILMLYIEVSVESAATQNKDQCSIEY